MALIIRWGIEHTYQQQTKTKESLIQGELSKKLNWRMKEG
jgi:hypothetical protein